MNKLTYIRAKPMPGAVKNYIDKVVGKAPLVIGLGDEAVCFKGQANTCIVVKGVALPVSVVGGAGGVSLVVNDSMGFSVDEIKEAMQGAT